MDLQRITGNKTHEYDRLTAEDVESSSSAAGDGRSTPETRYGPRGRSGAVHYVAYSVLVILNMILSGLLLRANKATSQCLRPQLVYSPAIEAIEYVPKRLERQLEGNPFAGEPRPEFDAAWKHLLEPMTIRISKEELAHLPDPSIALKDGSGYIAELTAYHEIHCIKRIRRHFHLQRYYGNMTEDEKNREEIHIDHCLEYWREAAVCRGDPTLSTFQWLEGLPFSRVYSDHECVNWEKFDAWARTRMVDTSDLSVLVGFEEHQADRIQR